MIDALLAAHLEMEIASEADVIVLLEMLDVEDNTAFLASGPQTLTSRCCCSFRSGIDDSIFVDADRALAWLGIADD